MISDVLSEALADIDYYLNDSTFKYNKNNPYLAKCRAAMEDCMVYYQTPRGHDPFPRVKNWRAWNAATMVEGNNPLTLQEYLDLVGEAVADEEDKHRSLRNWRAYNRARVANGKAELEFDEYVETVGETVANSDNPDAGSVN